MATNELFGQEWVAEAFHPRLLITVDGVTITLRWPAPFASAILESSQALDGGWQSVAGTAFITNNFWQLSVPVVGENNFFRLHTN